MGGWRNKGMGDKRYEGGKINKFEVELHIKVMGEKLTPCGSHIKVSL